MPSHDPLPQKPPNKALGRAPAHGISNPHAWARYRRVMGWMAGLAVVCVVATLGCFWWLGGPMPLPMVIATSVGVFMTVMIGTGLMSLVFLSAGSGHDADAADPFDAHQR